MSKKMLTRHNLLVKVKEEVKMKETIQAFINEETESQIATAEIIYGFQKCITPCQKNDGNTMLFGSDESYKKKTRKTGNLESVGMITGYGSVVPSRTLFR